MKWRRSMAIAPTYFRRMLADYGGVQAAKRLLQSHDIQSGLMELAALGLLDHSMEALVLEERFKTLFSEEEKAEARRRLEALDYFKA